MKDILAQHFPGTTIGEAESGHDAIELMRQAGWNRYISPALTGRLQAKAKPGAKKLPHERLSRREFQVMRLTPSGKSLKEIAGELSISVQTVSTHRARILKKMGMQSTAELIRYALENALAG